MYIFLRLLSSDYLNEGILLKSHGYFLLIKKMAEIQHHPETSYNNQK